MTRRFLQVLGVAILIVSIGIVLKVTGVGLASKGAGAEKATLTTAWGDPDLQGIWREDYETPLQRPAMFAGSRFMTGF